MIYKTTKQFARGPEIILESFREYSEAEHFVQIKLSEDIQYKVQATYRIYEFDEVMKEFTQKDAKIPGAPPSSSSQAASGQAGKKQVFSPTPFNTKPQPGGLPRSSIIEMDDEEGKK
jgi:hypothetical protein